MRPGCPFPFLAHEKMREVGGCCLEMQQNIYFCAALGRRRAGRQASERIEVTEQLPAYLPTGLLAYSPTT